MQDVTLVSNYSNIADYAEHVWSRAHLMYKEKAYLHWYSKFNVGEVRLILLYYILNLIHPRTLDTVHLSDQP